MPLPNDIITDRTLVPGPSGTVVGGEVTTSNTNRITALEALVSPVTKGIIPARYYGPLETLSGWSAPVPWTMTANTLYAGPFQWAINAVIVGARVTITTAQTGGIHLGIYSFGLTGRPLQLVLDLGVLDASVTGDRNTPSVNVTLPRGSYWIAGAANVTGIAMNSILAGFGVTSTLGHANTDGTAPRSACFRLAALTSGFTTLPTTFSTISTTGIIPAFWLVSA
jgi:hypothetical protein